MTDRQPYNPLDKASLGQSIAQALLESDVLPLTDMGRLKGAGIYVIYYTGDFSAYRPVAVKNLNNEFQQAIYVGKAIRKGGRKGGLGPALAAGTALRDRLRQHANSIEEVKNLLISDFYYRALVVDDIWIPLGENMLIEQHKPVWNVVIDGFGNKDPGRRRDKQYKSSWDVVHPGRKFTDKLAESGLKPEAVISKVEKYLAGQTVTLIQVDENGQEDLDEEI